MKMLKKTLCVFLAILMLFSAMSVSLVAFAADEDLDEAYRALAYSFFKYTIKPNGYLTEYVVDTDSKGYPSTSILGDMDSYELSNHSDEYVYEDEDENPIRLIAYDHLVTAKDNSAGLIRSAVTEYLKIVDKIMSKEYGVGLYTLPMVADEVADTLKFTKGDNGEYLFLDGYTYVEDAVGKIVYRSPEKTYKVVDGEIVELDVDDSWKKGYESGYNFITLFDYCNVATIMDYFNGNCTSVNSGSWFHEYAFHCYTDIDTVLTTEALVADNITEKYLTISWSSERQFDESGLKPQYFNAGYQIVEDETVDDNAIRSELIDLQAAFTGYFDKYYANDFLKNVSHDDLAQKEYNAIRGGRAHADYKLFQSLSNEAMLAVFGQSAYSYMHLVNQLTPMANHETPQDTTFWPKHTYEKYPDENGNPEVYQVDSYKVESIVKTIDSILTNEKLGDVVKSFLTLQNQEKASRAKSPQDVLVLFIEEMLFQDSIVNMILEMVYPMVCGLLDDLLTDEFINNVLKLEDIDLGKIISVIIDKGAGWQSLIYAALASIGVTLTPAGMAYVWNKYGYLDPQYGYTTTFPEFQAMHDHLKEARGGITESGLHNTGDYYAIGAERDGYCGDRWKDVDFSKMVWNINGDKDKFLKALDAVLAPLAPLLGVLLGDTDCTIEVVNLLGTDLVENPLRLILNDSSITHNLYDTVLVPVFEVLGINKTEHGLLTGEEFEKAAADIKSDSSRRPDTISEFLNKGILNPLLDWATETVLADPITTVLNLLPNLSYFLTSGAVLKAVNSITIPIRISHSILFGAGITVYTLELGELLGEDTLGFLDSVQGILDLIGLKVDTGIPVIGYHAKGETAVYRPGMATYNPDVHNIPVSEAYISSNGEMSTEEDDYWFKTKVTGFDENGEYTEYAIRHEIGWRNWKGEVVTERDEVQMESFTKAVLEYYEYTVTEYDYEEEKDVNVTYKVAGLEYIPDEILESGDYKYVCDVETIKEKAALPPIMDYKLQGTGTIKEAYSCRYSSFSTNNETWGSHKRKYIDLKIADPKGDTSKDLETEGLVLMFLFRYILSAVMYRPYSNGIFTSDYTLIDAFGLDAETLNGELFAGLRIKDIIDNIALHPDEALAALLELFYKNEFGSLWKVENGKVVAGDAYTYDIYPINYHADEIISAAEKHDDYSYGTAVLYTENWTKDKSEYIVDNLEDIVKDVFAMLKLDGFDSLGGMLENLVGEMLFTNDMISDLGGMLYGLISGLGGSIDIVAILEAALGVKLTKQVLVDALVYEFGDAIKAEKGTYIDEETGEIVEVTSVYKKLIDDINEANDLRNEAAAAYREGNYELQAELLEKAAEAEKFFDFDEDSPLCTFFELGSIETEVVDKQTGEPTGEIKTEYFKDYAYDWGYYNSDIKSTYSDAKIFLKAASAILSPFAILIKFLFMGDDLMLLRHELKDENGDTIYDADGNPKLSEVGLINIPSYEIYHYAWIPLMETLGATDELISFKAYFEKAFNGATETSRNCDTIYYLLSPIIGLVENVFANPIEVVLNLIPNLLFFLSIGGLNGLVNNIAHFAYVLLDILSPIVDAYPVVNSLLGNIRIGDMALNLSLPLDVDVNQLVNELLSALLGDTLSFDITNKNIVLGTEEVIEQVKVPVVDEFNDPVYDKNGVPKYEYVDTTVVKDVYAVGTLSIALPFIDLSTLCSGTMVEKRSVSGNTYIALDTDGGADLITLIFRLITDTLFFEDNAENIANFLIGFAQLDDEDDNDEVIMDIFTYLNAKANEADAPDLIMNLLYYVIVFLVPVADELGSRFKKVDFSVMDMFNDSGNIMDYISALLDAGSGPPNQTLTGFKKLIQLLKEFFAKIAAVFSSLFGG